MGLIHVWSGGFHDLAEKRKESEGGLGGGMKGRKGRRKEEGGKRGR